MYMDGHVEMLSQLACNDIDAPEVNVSEAGPWNHVAASSVRFAASATVVLTESHDQRERERETRQGGLV